MVLGVLSGMVLVRCSVRHCFRGVLSGMVLDVLSGMVLEVFCQAWC